MSTNLLILALMLITFLAADKMFLFLAEVLRHLNLSEGKDHWLAFLLHPCPICHASALVRKIMDVDLLSISYLHHGTHLCLEKSVTDKVAGVNTVSLPLTVSLLTG